VTLSREEAGALYRLLMATCFPASEYGELTHAVKVLERAMVEAENKSS
jgi:hypothetical protein